jgi:acyl-CoA carboxylase epsilon subunit
MDELRVVRGNPDDFELAALVIVHAALRARRPASEPRRSSWARPGGWATGSAAWRRSGLPG